MQSANTQTQTVATVHSISPGPHTANPDNLGNLYFGNTFGNNVVKVVIATGVRTTVAGSGSAGFANGAAGAARFHYPYTALATSDGLWLLVADTYNHQIRRVALANGAVTTFAGGGGTNVVGNANGVGTNARMGISNTALGFVLDAANNGFLADNDYNVIRRIDYATAAVTTVAGGAGSGFANGPGATALFSGVQSLALVPPNLIFVNDAGNYRVRLIKVGGSCALVLSPPTPTPSPGGSASRSTSPSRSRSRGGAVSRTASSTRSRSRGGAASRSASASRSPSRGVVASRSRSASGSRSASRNSAASRSASPSRSRSATRGGAASSSGSRTRSRSRSASAPRRASLLPCVAGRNSWLATTPLAANISVQVAGARFGASLAALPNGTVLFVGAPGANRVYLFASSPACGAAWAPSAGGPLTGGDTAVGDTFGSAVAVAPDGRTLFVGAPARAGGAGGIYLFSLAGSAWVQAGAPLAYAGAPANARIGGAIAVAPDGAAMYATAPGVAGTLFIAWSRNASVAAGWAAAPLLSVRSPCGFLPAPLGAAFFPGTGAGAALAIANANFETGWNKFAAIALRDDGDWAWGPEVVGGSAVAVSPDGSTVLVGDVRNRVVRVYAGVVPGAGWPGAYLLPKTSAAYSAPGAADAYASAVAVAPSGSFTAVGAPNAAGGGAVFIYAAAPSSSASATASPIASPASASPLPTVPCGTRVTFSYTGAPQLFKVPAGVTWASVFMWGAGGPGGAGAYVQGNLSVTPGETLRVVVGAGAVGAAAAKISTAGGAGGYGNTGYGGGRSAVQRVYAPADVAALTALWGVADATARGLTRGFFADVVTAGGGGTGESPGAGGLASVRATSYAGPLKIFAGETDACGKCTSGGTARGCPAWPYSGGTPGGGGGWCGGGTMGGDNTGGASGGSSWTAALHNAVGLSGIGGSANPASTGLPWYPGGGVGNSGTRGAVVIMPLCAAAAPPASAAAALFPAKLCASASPSVSATRSRSATASASRTASTSLFSTVCVSAPTGNTVSATCPAGAVITRVLFQSYGNPTGSCPSGPFSLGSCPGAAGNGAIVNSTCLGLNSCSIRANAVLAQSGGGGCGGPTTFILYAQCMLVTPTPSPSTSRSRSTSRSKTASRPPSPSRSTSVSPSRRRSYTKSASATASVSHSRSPTLSVSVSRSVSHSRSTSASVSPTVFPSAARPDFPEVYSCTGNFYHLVIPTPMNLTVFLWGAGGGQFCGGAGGAGAYVTGLLPLLGGTTLRIIVGLGGRADTPGDSAEVHGAGGDGYDLNGYVGAGGGGRSAIQRWNASAGVWSEIVTAGGGGGNSEYNQCASDSVYTPPYSFGGPASWNGTGFQGCSLAQTTSASGGCGGGSTSAGGSCAQPGGQFVGGNAGPEGFTGCCSYLAGGGGGYYSGGGGTQCGGGGSSLISNLVNAFGESAPLSEPGKSTGMSSPFWVPGTRHRRRAVALLLTDPEHHPGRRRHPHRQPARAQRAPA